MPAANLLLRMQSTRIHMALVVDEYGGTAGVVTLAGPDGESMTLTLRKDR